MDLILLEFFMIPLLIF